MKSKIMNTLCGTLFAGASLLAAHSSHADADNFRIPSYLMQCRDTNSNGPTDCYTRFGGEISHAQLVRVLPGSQNACQQGQDWFIKSRKIRVHGKCNGLFRIWEQ